jgi:hypothetical protein
MAPQFTSSRALLARPRAVFEALWRLGAGRWTRREVAAAVVVAVRFIRRVVDLRAKATPARGTLAIARDRRGLQLTDAFPNGA